MAVIRIALRGKTREGVYTAMVRLLGSFIGVQNTLQYRFLGQILIKPENHAREGGHTERGALLPNIEFPLSQQ
jgi:hypothetical protein